MSDLTISKLADAGAVGVETVRFYQRRGLLPEPARAGGIRRYGPGDVQRLRFIRTAQAAGFTLEEIARLLELDALNDRAQARQMASARIAALDAKIEELKTVRGALARLAKECASSKEGPCPILSAFDG